MPFRTPDGLWHPNNNSSAAFATEAEARAAESGPAVSYGDDEFNVRTAPQTPRAPKPKPAPFVDTRTAAQKAQDAFDNGNIGGAGGAYNAVSDEGREVFDENHRNNQGGVDWGDVGDFAVDLGEFGLNPYGKTAKVLGAPPIVTRTLNMTSPYGMLTNGVDAINAAFGPGKITDPSGGGTDSSLPPITDAPPAGPRDSERTNDAKQGRQDALDDLQDESDQDEFDVRQAINDYKSSYNDDKSAESRADQQTALRLQNDLLNRILGFDPNAYADQFSDNALANATALARSAPGGAGARQAALFSALDKMPSIEAEAQRQAQVLENQRLNSAQAAVGKFGDLAFGVRSQDINEQQFESDIAKNIVDDYQNVWAQDDATNLAVLTNWTNVYTTLVQNDLGWANLNETERENRFRDALAQAGFEEQVRQFDRLHPEPSAFEEFMGHVDQGVRLVVAAKTGGLI